MSVRASQLICKSVLVRASVFIQESVFIGLWPWYSFRNVRWLGLTRDEYIHLGKCVCQDQGINLGKCVCQGQSIYLQKYVGQEQESHVEKYINSSHGHHQGKVSSILVMARVIFGKCVGLGSENMFGKCIQQDQGILYIQESTVCWLGPGYKINLRKV